MEVHREEGVYVTPVLIMVNGLRARKYISKEQAGGTDSYFFNIKRKNDRRQERNLTEVY